MSSIAKFLCFLWDSFVLILLSMILGYMVCSPEVPGDVKGIVLSFCALQATAITVRWFFEMKCLICGKVKTKKFVGFDSIDWSLDFTIFYLGEIEYFLFKNRENDGSCDLFVFGPDTSAWVTSKADLVFQTFVYLSRGEKENTLKYYGKESRTAIEIREKYKLDERLAKFRELHCKKG